MTASAHAHALHRSHHPSNDRLVEQFAEHSDTLGLSVSAVELRIRAARRFVAAHPDLGAWLSRPIPARLVDLDRIKAWTFLGWAILAGHLQADIEFLLVKHAGGLSRTAEMLFADQFAIARAAAGRLGWSAGWDKEVIGRGVTLALAVHAPAGDLTGEALDAITETVKESLTISATTREQWQHHLLPALGDLFYEAGWADRPRQRTRPGAGGAIGILDAVSATEIRHVMVRYLQTRAAILRPGSTLGLANDLACFGEFLATHHPDVVSLTDLQRHHIETFCRWASNRPYRGRRKNSGRHVAASAAAHSVIALRNFLDDITLWGWAERPDRQLVFATDIPRQPKKLPRALNPDHDTALMAAVARLDDQLARAGLTMLRGTGMRIGELLDLELDCIVDYGTLGTWLRVPLGKLDTERSVPLDDPTLEALDDWISRRGPQRSLPNPRTGRPADYLFVEHGRRPASDRLRRALITAAGDAGLVGPDNTPLRVVPHQLRHTYATTLANAGMSLQALMALLGHRSPDMTMRYATLASPTLKQAYDEAIGKMRRHIPVAFAGKPAIPHTTEWLRAELLKTRIAHGYCSRDLAAEACPYANICEQCDNFATTAEFVPALQAQLDDVRALHADAVDRGWDSEAARHARVIDSIESHLRRLDSST